MASAIIRAEPRVTNNHQTEPTLPRRPARGAVGSEERPRDVHGVGRRDYRHVCSDRTKHASQWESAGGRAVAMDGLLRLHGGARLRDAWCWSSRMEAFVTEQSFLHADKNFTHFVMPCV